MKGKLANAVIFGAVALGLVALVWSSLMDARHAQSGVQVGDVAPPFVMEKYGGGEVSLEQLRGQVVMLDFWATWCPPCIREMPYMTRLAKEFEPQGLSFVAASRDDQRAAVGIFVAQKVPDLKSYVTFAPDPVARAYRVEALPTLFFIDREGRIAEVHRGMVSEKQLRELIVKMLQRPATQFQ